MAFNGYYQSHGQNPYPTPPYSTHPYSSGYSPTSVFPPPYTSNQDLRDLPTRSPFSTPFDAPADGSAGVNGQHLHLSDDPYSASSNSTTLNTTRDTAYHSPGGGLHRTPSQDMADQRRIMPDDGGITDNDIPLQDRRQRDHRSSSSNNKPDPADLEGSDHVYDVTEQQQQRGQKGARKVRFGEMGMIGADVKRIPWVVYTFTLIQVAVFIGELIRNAQLTGSPIMIKPQFNPMIGPSTYVLINMGARFVPCMHNLDAVQGRSQQIDWPCPNSTTDDATSPMNQCTLSDLCGFGGVPEPRYDGNVNQQPEPNQWFRFIVPIFLHAGLVHIGFNLLLQLTMGREMEKAIGSIRFVLVYLSAGIFGFVMGGNYAATGISSTGASGALFGVIALTLLDLLYSWRERRRPGKDLALIFFDIAVSFVLGLLPGLDNFSHIGGFLMGLALGVCILHSPNALRRRIGDDVAPYSLVHSAAHAAHDTATPPSLFKNPIGFFKGRKPLWWAWWLIRASALVAVFIVFILLLNNFYIYRRTCSWCKYLSCLPINNWCEIGNLTLTTTDPSGSSNNNARSFPLLLARGMERLI